MSPATLQIVVMLNILPKHEQEFAYEMPKRIILAWDPDYTKLTADEAKRLELGKKQLTKGEYFRDSEIDWDNLDKMNLDE